MIYSQNHDYRGECLPYDLKSIHKPVTIGKNVWIGMNVCISPGVSIGDGAIIGIGSVVSKDLESGAIFVAKGGKQVSKRDLSHYDLLENSSRYGGVNGRILEDSLIDQFKKSYKEHRYKEFVFVLSTGRSGSTSIVDILNQHSKCLAFHEKIRQLIRISTLKAYNEENNHLYVELEDLFDNIFWEGNSERNLIIHSDQRLWNLVPFLSDFFPNSKFIHLTRESVACIKSMIARGWYSKNEFYRVNNNDWALYRLDGSKIGVYSGDEWKGLSQLQKCTWYYFYVNKYIKDSLIELKNDDRWASFSIDNLNTELLQEFLNLEIENLTVSHSNVVRERHKSRLNDISRSKQLSQEIISFLNSLH